MSNTRVTMGVGRFNQLPMFLKIICLVLFGCGIIAAIFYQFNISINMQVLESTLYYYILYTCFTSLVFIIVPIKKTQKHMSRVPWYDFVLATILFCCCAYFASQFLEIRSAGWARDATTANTCIAGIVLLLSLESGRRIAGWPLVLLALLIGTYPLYAGMLPGIMFGFQVDIGRLVSAFAFGGSGMLGLPGRVVGDILIGFLVFAGILITTGGGKFFISFATALMGKYRGGPAKVAVIASGFFGSLSGSPMTNVVGTGSFTIPTMMRTGYPPEYAGAIEAVASTGGMIMPPIMGTVAFIMAELAGVPYSEIIIAAFIPAFLFYWGLIIQVDSYAARVGLQGMSRNEIPSLRETLKDGWKYIIVLAFLVFGLIYMRWGARAPFFASGLLLLLACTNRSTFLTPRKLAEILGETGTLITYITAIMLPIGLLLVGLQLPGTLTAITAELVTMAGSAPVIVILLIAALLSYLFGMIGLAIVPYIVLAVIIVPSLATATGMDPLAIHLFLMCYLIIAGITPPVATTAFVASGISGSPPMRTAILASRLAIVIYFIPFFFVFNTGLILRAPSSEIFYSIVLAVIGIWILASGLEGYIFGIGRLTKWARPLLSISGLLFAYPDWRTVVIGAAVAIITLAVSYYFNRIQARRPV